MTRIITLVILCVACRCAVNAQSTPVWIWSEHSHLMMLEADGGRKVITDIPWADRYAKDSLNRNWATATALSLAQHGKEWHIACSNVEGVYYMYSPDEGRTWSTVLVDHIRNHPIYTHDPVSGAKGGAISETEKYLALNNAMEIVVDRNGNPHIAYLIDGGNIFYDSFVIHATPVNGKWQTERVQTATGQPERYVNHVAIDVDRTGRPHVLVSGYHKTGSSESYAIDLFSKAGTSWHQHRVSPENNYLPTLEFKIGANGIYHAVGTVKETAMYWYSTDKGVTWKEETLMKGNCRFDLQVDGEGNPHIGGSCYNDGVYYGKRENGKWKLTEAENRDQMCHARVVVSPEGVGGVAFFTSYHGAADLFYYYGKAPLRTLVLHTEGGRSSSLQPVVAFVNGTKNDPSTPGAVPMVHEERPIFWLHKVETKYPEAEISLYDDEVEDGDTISLSVNGEWVLERVEIRKERRVVKIRLKPGENQVVMYALNEGRIVPNTATLEVYSGQEQHAFQMRSSLTGSGGMRIIYMPE